MCGMLLLLRAAHAQRYLGSCYQLQCCSMPPAQLRMPAGMLAPARPLLYLAVCKHSSIVSCQGAVNCLVHAAVVHHILADILQHTIKLQAGHKDKTIGADYHS